MLEDKYDYKISKADKNGNCVLSFLRTMNKNGERFYRYYKNCKFFAVVD
ncbi:hypothetical protein M8O60_001396 [Campylobacter jejuni]|nr:MULTISPECIES: hypothetical protein [Campylobacter]EIZ6318877.1 hypothetical protein [Campylobacter jejuni]EJF4579868.1 hypothetical protein [Campylobacter jejuni]EJO4391716.1 hypothetical protein [Campylobacter jejuni]EKL0233355.1 hypothetical protein [Campylobacter jejuni]ELV6765475.1 hypothetical protein [Campylobacter jejuni]